VSCAHPTTAILAKIDCTQHLQVEANQEALSAMPYKNYGKFARWAQSQKLGMVKQVLLFSAQNTWRHDADSIRGD
jgi:hypothetical protein